MVMLTQTCIISVHKPTFEKCFSHFFNHNFGNTEMSLSINCARKSNYKLSIIYLLENQKSKEEKVLRITMDLFLCYTLNMIHLFKLSGK